MELSTGLGLGGQEAVVARLVRSADPERFEMSACTIDHLGHHGEELCDDGFTVHNLAKGPGLKPSLWLKLARILRRERIDVVHGHNFQTLFWGLPAAKLARTTAFVYTVHGNLYRKSPRIARAEKLLIRFATKVTAISQSSRHELDGDRIFPAKKVLVIPNGIDAGDYEIDVDRAGVRRELGLPPEGPALGICSRIVAAKGVDHLIRAMPKVIGRFPGASTLVVGDGDAVEGLRALAKELAVAERVVFTGQRQDVPRLLGAMDLFVLPSESEGLSMALLEAMAAGLPAVATNVGDNAIAIRDGETGRIVELDQIDRLPGVLIELLSDEERLRSMGGRARQRAVEHYSHERMTENYERLFAELAEK